jgi:outer membrane lipoprotein-sorting protein
MSPKKILLFAAITILAIVSTGFSYFYNVQKISVRMVTRTAQKGQTGTIMADVYYLASGKMVTHFFDPKEYFVINNAKGEMSVYDPKKNTAMQQQNIMYSTETSQLYFFLQNKKSDLGLKSMGFSVTDTRFEQDLMITHWSPPLQAAKLLREVELVHKGPNPIYMKYVDKEGKNAKKIYYYNYTTLNGVDFPMAITQIDFVASDSIITKTTYSDIKVNEAAEHPLFNYSIPANARTLK